MEKLSRNKWLITVLGGIIAAVATAYFLYLFPPERIFGQPDAKPAVDSDLNEGTGGPGLTAFQEVSASQKAERLDTLAQSSGPSDPAIQDSRPGPAGTGAKTRRVPQGVSGQEELRPGAVSLFQARATLLSPDTPILFSKIDTVVSVTFRETLGSSYAEFVVDTPRQKSFRFPVRNAGITREFEIGGQRYEIRVIAIDWQAMTAHILLRPTGS